MPNNIDSSNQASVFISNNQPGWLSVIQIHHNANFRGDWVTASSYVSGDVWRDTVSENLFITLSPYQAGQTTSDDISQGFVIPYQDITAVKPVRNVDSLRKFEPLYSGQQVQTLGHTIEGIGALTFYYDSDISNAVDNNGTVIITAEGKVWKAIIQKGDWLSVSAFGAKTGKSLREETIKALDVHGKVIIDVDGYLQDVSIPSNRQIKLEANIILGTGSSQQSQTNDGFKIENQSNIILDFNKQGGFEFRRPNINGTGRILHIHGNSDYSNKNITIKNLNASGGSGTFNQWSACENILWENCYIHDGNGNGFYNINTTTSNSYKSRNIRFKNITISDLGIDSDSISHGISINSWRYVEDVIIEQCSITRVRNNGIEIWANNVQVNHNYVEDARIAFSYGQCHYLSHGAGNIARCLNPNTNTSNTSTGGIGIEIGGCTHATIHAGVIDGYRHGISATESVINQDTIWHDPTALTLATAGTLSENPTSELPKWVRLKTLENEPKLSGSYYVSIIGGVITNYVFFGIRLSGDVNFNDTYVVNGVRISHGGKYGDGGQPNNSYSAIFLQGCEANINSCSITNTEHHGINLDQARVTLGVNTFNQISGNAVRVVGSGSQWHIPVRQKIKNCQNMGSVIIGSPTQGTIDAGDEWINHNILDASSFSKFRCLESGTYGNMLLTTADTTDNNIEVTFRRINTSPIGAIQLGVYVNIGGSSNVYRIEDIGIVYQESPNGTSPVIWAVKATLDTAPDTTQSNVNVEYHTPTTVGII